MTSTNIDRILIADDDADDRLLIADAFQEAQLPNPVSFVTDGVDLLGYLKREGPYKDETDDYLPGIILLDLNMPRMDGRTALAEIRKDPELKAIPVIVLTTSKSKQDVQQIYNLGVNSYITKPKTFGGLVDVAQALQKYWFEVSTLPHVN